MSALSRFEEYLKPNSGKSSLRLKTVIALFTCCICLLIIVIGEAIKSDPDWIDAAVSITAIGGIIGVVLWGKNQGKEKEKQNEVS